MLRVIKADFIFFIQNFYYFFKIFILFYFTLLLFYLSQTILCEKDWFTSRAACIFSSMSSDVSLLLKA